MPPLFTPKRTAQRQPGGIVCKLATFIVNTSLPKRLSGSAIETEVISCDGWPSLSSPAGSKIAVTPGAWQAPVASLRGSTTRETELLDAPSPTPFIAVMRYVRSEEHT